MTPDSETLTVFGKIAALVSSFLGGIVTATWIVAKKTVTYDAKIELLERSHKEMSESISGKLDTLHARIDQILLGRSSEVEFRHRGRDHEES